MAEYRKATMFRPVKQVVSYLFESGCHDWIEIQDECLIFAIHLVHGHVFLQVEREALDIPTDEFQVKKYSLSPISLAYARNSRPIYHFAFLQVHVKVHDIAPFLNGMMVSLPWNDSFFKSPGV